MTRISVTLHEHISTFKTMSRLILHITFRLQAKFGEKTKYILYSIIYVFHLGWVGTQTQLCY